MESTQCRLFHDLNTSPVAAWRCVSLEEAKLAQHSLRTDNSASVVLERQLKCGHLV